MRWPAACVPQGSANRCSLAAGGSGRPHIRLAGFSLAGGVAFLVHDQQAGEATV